VQRKNSLTSQDTNGDSTLSIGDSHRFRVDKTLVKKFKDMSIEKVKFHKVVDAYLQILKKQGIEYKRENSICPLPEKCGSCPLSHIPYDVQLSIKSAYVQLLLNKACPLCSIEDTLIVPSVPNTDYRGRMDYAVDYNGALGLKEKGTWYSILGGHTCILPIKSIRQAFDIVNNVFLSHKVHGFDRKAKKGFLSFVVIRGTLTGEVSINFVFKHSVLLDLYNNNEKQLQKEIKNLLGALNDIVNKVKETGLLFQGFSFAITKSLREESVGKIVAVYNIDNEEGVFSINKDALQNEFDIDYSKLFDKQFNAKRIKLVSAKELEQNIPVVKEVLSGVTYRIAPFSFFQPNMYTAGILQQLVVFVMQLAGVHKSDKLIKQPHIVLDLFGGVGFLGGYVAKILGYDVDVVEVDKDAVIQGRTLWHKENNVQNVNLIHADAYDYQIEDKYATIILDPPRRGLTKKLIKQLLKLEKLQNLVYVSCNIKQFAVEFSTHLSNFFDIQEVLLLDQFPHTEHVETIMLLKKKK